MLEVAEGIRQLTFALPLGIDHVHCYLLPRETGGWTLVDTGLGLPGVQHAWAEVLEGLSEPVEQIFVTHFHPDHVGGGAIVAELTGAPVLQGRLDYQYCLGAWANPESGRRSEEHLLRHGMPPAEAAVVGASHERLADAVRFARDPEPVDPGDPIDGWEILHLPGHADGHLALLRNGVLVAGDALLGDITPNVGIYPGSVPDPLAEYLSSLERIASLAPRVALPGHGSVIEDPAGRAREIHEHHLERLELVAGSLDSRPRSAYDLSLELFPDDLPPPLRRMALAETLAHLEHLALRGELGRDESDGRICYRMGP